MVPEQLWDWGHSYQKKIIKRLSKKVKTLQIVEPMLWMETNTWTLKHEMQSKPFLDIKDLFRTASFSPSSSSLVLHDANIFILSVLFIFFFIIAGVFM